ncbi:PrnA protein [Emericellopsis atlantica]|uniref:PrnA protein n=1 Tax=Emericellopsis atlantica TaxID=2614577 RepID=A0A9P8CT62_9HYPO|nr:PrnA protein [Emericellopsis atlantica]KAG9258839.1 PrnA protein [Emericellopsis atlantica]
MTRRMANMERLLTHFVGNVKLDGDTLQHLADSVEKKRLDQMPPEEDAEVKSNSSGDVKLDEITVQPLENNATHYSGEFSHWNFSMRIKQWIEATGPHRTDAPDAPKIKEFYRFDELQAPPDASGLSSSLPPRQIADVLTRAFFCHAEGDYFFVDRTWLNRKMDVVYENPASLSRRDVPTLAIIYMVLAVGTQYVYLDSLGGKTNNNASFSEDAIGIKFYQQACKLLPDVIAIASLESTQACLLIGLYTLPLDPSGLAWTYINLAMKLAIQNGMHRNYPGEGLELVIRETRNRVWWTLYALERRVGTFHGRPVSVLDGEIDASYPVDRQDIWPGSPPQNTAQFHASIHLCGFIGRVRHEISLFKAADRQTTFCALARLVDIKDELHKWWQTLPSEVCSQNPAMDGAVSRAAVHVRLEFCVLRMYAGRIFITPLNNSAMGPRSSSKGRPSVEPASSEAGEPSPRSVSLNARRRSIMIADCVDAALSIVDLCRLLQNTIGLARASYTEFSGLRVALLVILSQFIEKQQQDATERLRQPLYEGIAMLKNMAAWGASARFDASLIEAFEHAIARMEVPDNPQEPVSRESDYEMFKKWQMEWQGSGVTSKHVNGGSVGDDKAFDPALGIPSLTGNAASGGWGSVAGPKATTPLAMPSVNNAGAFGTPADWGSSGVATLGGLSDMLGQGYGFDIDLGHAPTEGDGRGPDGWTGMF